MAIIFLVTWWERGLTDATSDEPVGRMSTDGGQKFNEMIQLSTTALLAERRGEGYSPLGQH
jgi:hypothetical protein